MNNVINEQELKPALKESIEKQLASINPKDCHNVPKEKLADLIFHKAKDNPNISPNQPININVRTFYIVLTQLSSQLGLGGRWIPYATDSHSLYAFPYDNPSNFTQGTNFSVGSETLNATWMNL